MASSGQASNLLRDLRVRSIYSPYYFAKVVLGYDKLVPHLHQADTEMFVSRWARGVRRQAVEWPRAFYKTTTFTISCGIWHVLPVSEEDHIYALDTLGLDEEEWILRTAVHDQDATQLFAFETLDNAVKKLSQIRWHFEENELFRACFPEIARDGTEPRWTNDCLTIRRVGPRRRDAEGTFEAIGVGGALQSRHYKTVWEDDLVGENARRSDKVMADTIGWHGRLSGAFENASTAECFLISNRWGFADLNSFVRENEPEVQFYTRAAWETRDGEEVSIFPEQYSIEFLKKLQDSGSMSRYDFACQYLNSPTLPGEKELDLTKRHFYTVNPDGQIKCSCGGTYYPSQLLRYMHYDPYNAKASSTSCPALAVVGTSSDEHVFLLAGWTNKGSYANIFSKIFEFNDHYHPKLFTYEDVGHQNMAEYHWKEISRTAEYKAANHLKPPQILGVKTGNRSKEARIRDHFFPIIEQRKFSTRKSLTTLDSQLETFPNKVFDHDYDLLDCLAQGAPHWKYPTGDDYLLAQRTEEDAYKSQLGKGYSYASVS